MKRDKKKKKRDDMLSRSEKIELAAAIHELMVEGNSDGDIIEELGVTAQDFAAGKKFLLQSIGDEHELMTPKERFAGYLIKSEANLSSLDDLVTNLNHKTQYNVVLGAIRLRQEIQNQIINTGQTLGLIAKEPERKILLGGLAVTDLADKDLRKGVVNAIAGLSGLFDKYGDGQNLRQLTPGKLHYGEAIEVKSKTEIDTAALGAPPMKEKQKDKRNRARANKRSAGRRRVKE